MNLLCPMAGSTNDADNRVVCQSTGATDASQTAAFTVSLQDLANLLWANVPMVVEGIKAFVEGLSAARAVIPLDSTRHFAMLMHLQVSTQWAFHRLSNEVSFLLLYLTHRNLTHDQSYFCLLTP